MNPKDDDGNGMKLESKVKHNKCMNEGECVLQEGCCFQKI